MGRTVKPVLSGHSKIGKTKVIKKKGNLGSQSENVPDVSCVKSSAKVMIWGAMGVSGLSNLHIVPTVDSSFHIEHILKKELKPALNGQGQLEKLILGNWYPTLVWLSLCRMGLPHIRRPQHRHGATTTPNFIGKQEWPGNSPNLNCIENLWSILDYEAYKDPRPSTMPQLLSRLQYAWRTIPLQHMFH